jgi:hypothetical protein
VDIDVGAVASDALSFVDTATLFGESASRVVVSCEPGKVAELLAAAKAAGVPAAQVGTVGGNRIRLSVGGRRLVDEPLAEAERIWATAIEGYFARSRAIA